MNPIIQTRTRLISGIHATIYRSLKGVKGELVSMLYLEVVQDIRWGWGGSKPAGYYTFFYRNWNENHEIGTEFFVCMGIIPAGGKVFY
jgi:hypothetical protein